uniref:Uncharacterized protein n=1 Tax=Globodera pallida TaxID=36090 RepID=A0A183BXC0_GLOPA
MSLVDRLLPAEAAQMVKARSELINRVQKAKNAIDRVVPEKTEEMLRKLIPHEVPIDMLCSIYCASGELSQFSGWLAALNAQTQELAPQALARAMREFEIACQKPTALVSTRFAQRPLPPLLGRKLTLLRADKEELKEEKQRLKEVFLCANQQGWASPDAVAESLQCVTANGHLAPLLAWPNAEPNPNCHCGRGGAFGRAVSGHRISPIPCLCKMIKQLVECVLFIPSAATSCSTRSSSTFPSTTITDAIPPLQQPGGVSMSESYAQQQKRHPIVGDLSPKATVMAKMLVRALQLLLWAGERSVLGKQEREKRLLQIYGIQQTTADGTCSRKRRHQSAQSSTTGTCSGTNTLKPPFPSLGAVAGSATDEKYWRRWLT